MDGDLERLGERIAEQAAHLDAAMHRLLADLRVFDERGGWRAQGALSCAHWLSWRVGWSLGTARDHVRVARKLSEFTTIDDALRRGEVSYAKVRAMVRIATPANELLLLDYARLMTGSQLEETCRKYALVLRSGQDPRPLADLQRRYVRRRDTDDGMVKIEAVLHPEEAELVWTMLNHAATALTRNPRISTPDVSAETQPTDRAASPTWTPAPVHLALEPSDASNEATASDVSAETQDCSRVVRSAAASPTVNVPVRRTEVSAEAQPPDHAASSTWMQPPAFAITACQTPAHSAPERADGANEAPTSHASAETLVLTEADRSVTAPPDVNVPIGRVDVFEETQDRDGAASSTWMQPSAHVAPQRANGANETWTSHGSAETLVLTEPAHSVAAPLDVNVPLRRVDVSAETQDPDRVASSRWMQPSAHVAPQRASGFDETRSAVCIEATMSDVSVETQESSQPDRLVAASPALNGPICRIDVSAEIRKRVAARIAAQAKESMDTASDAAEVSESKGILDRLLDEAEMQRATETRESSEHEVTLAEALPGTGDGVLRQRADANRRAFSRADALVSLAQAYLRGDRPNRAPIEVILTIPASSLRAGAVDPLEVAEIGESFVSSEAARRMSCDCGVVEVVEDEHGAPLSVGRKRRTINGMLKRALVQRDKTCTYPGCTNRLFLEGHHIKHWADGGETSLMNTALLCSTHHLHVHEYGYAIELDSEQRPRFRDPRGRLVAAVPDRAVPADLGWPQIRAANAPLEIDADTIACEWDGRPVNYGTIVGHLVVADGLQ